MRIGAFDVETSGTDVFRDKIIQSFFGIWDTENGRIGGTPMLTCELCGCGTDVLLRFGESMLCLACHRGFSEFTKGEPDDYLPRP